MNEKLRMYVERGMLQVVETATGPRKPQRVWTRGTGGKLESDERKLRYKKCFSSKCM